MAHARPRRATPAPAIPWRWQLLAASALVACAVALSWTLTTWSFTAGSTRRRDDRPPQDATARTVVIRSVDLFCKYALYCSHLPPAHGVELMRCLQSNDATDGRRRRDGAPRREDLELECVKRETESRERQVPRVKQHASPNKFVVRFLLDTATEFEKHLMRDAVEVFRELDDTFTTDFFILREFGEQLNFELISASTPMTTPSRDFDVITVRGSRVAPPDPPLTSTIALVEVTSPFARETISQYPNVVLHPERSEDDDFSETIHALRRAICDEILEHARLPRPINVAVVIAWTGHKIPSERIITVAQSFENASRPESGITITPLVLVEGHALSAVQAHLARHFPDERRASNIRVETPGNGNLTRYIHERVDALVPAVRGHAHYDIGWSLCDFRWLYGAIFSELLKPYTHWGWGDTDAVVGDIFGPITNRGRDLWAADVVSFVDLGTTPLDAELETTAQLGGQAFTSGTLTVIRNDARGVNLFRATPREKLEHLLLSPNNNIADEALTSNGVLSSLNNASVLLITSQVRNKDAVYLLDPRRGPRVSPLLYLPASGSAVNDLTRRLALAGRTHHPYSVVPLMPRSDCEGGKKDEAGDENNDIRVVGRFQGLTPLDNQLPARRSCPRSRLRYRPDRLSSRDFIPRKLSPGPGLGALMRSREGVWYHRPAPVSAMMRGVRPLPGNDRNWVRPIVGVEVAVAHVRSATSVEAICHLGTREVLWSGQLAYDPDHSEIDPFARAVPPARSFVRSRACFANEWSANFTMLMAKKKKKQKDSSK